MHAAAAQASGSSFMTRRIFDRQNLAGRCERVQADTEAPGLDRSGSQAVIERAERLCRVVVDRRAAAPVVFRVAEQFLGELAQHVAPEVEVAGHVPWRDAGWLEDASRNHMRQAGRERDARGPAAVQEERVALWASANGERVDARQNGTTGKVEQVADVLAERQVGQRYAIAGLAAAKPRKSHLVCKRLTHIDHVEIRGEAVRHPPASR